MFHLPFSYTTADRKLHAPNQWKRVAWSAESGLQNKTWPTACQKPLWVDWVVYTQPVYCSGTKINVAQGLTETSRHYVLCPELPRQWNLIQDIQFKLTSSEALTDWQQQHCTGCFWAALWWRWTRLNILLQPSATTDSSLCVNEPSQVSLYKNIKYIPHMSWVSTPKMQTDMTLPFSVRQVSYLSRLGLCSVSEWPLFLWVGPLLLLPPCSVSEEVRLRLLVDCCWLRLEPLASVDKYNFPSSAPELWLSDKRVRCCSLPDWALSPPMMPLSRAEPLPCLRTPAGTAFWGAFFCWWFGKDWSISHLKGCPLYPL